VRSTTKPSLSSELELVYILAAAEPNKAIGPPESRADDDGWSLADFEIQIS